MTDTRLPDRNLEPCNSVQEIIPLGTQKRPSSDGTSHPLSGRPRLEPTVILERTPKVISLLPKRTMPIKNLELGQREKSTAASLTGFNKSSRTDTDTLFSNCSVVVRKLQPNNINICSNKDVSFQPTVKKVPLQRSSSYNREREISLALSKELNENLRVFNSNSSANNQRHILPQPSHSRPASDSHTSFSNQKRPKSSVGTGERYAQHPDQRKDRPENKDHKHPVFSSMSSQKKLGTPHQKSTAEGRLSLSAKRRREASTDSEREIKRPCQGVQHKSSSSSTNSAQTFVRRAFVKSSSESLITLKERQSPRLPPPTPDTNKPTHPSSFLPRQLFKPSEFSSTFQHNTLTITGEPKDAKVAHANKNPKAPPSQPYLHKISPKSSTTFDSIETLFTPDPCVSPPKTNNKKINTESEGSVPSSHTSSSFSHKDGVKVRSPSLRPDPGTPSSAEQAVSCQMELDERTQFKVEQSRSPKANMPVPAASVKVEESGEKKYCPQWKDPLDIELGDELGDESRESCAISLSSSSDDEQLPSLREILDWSARVPVTPDKDAFSEPSTPAPKAAPEAVKTKAVSYRNTLEQMLQEKERYQRSKELERQLLESCEENLLNLSEDGENGESKEEDISHEQREFLQRFSVASCVIRDVHPGEEVFTPAKFGRLFSHQTLDLRRIGVTPHNRSQQILLQAHPEHVLSLISAGLLSKAYSSSPCQPEVTCWLFQMMSVHPNPVTSSRILQCLQSIAISAAEHIVEKHSQRFKVWVPTVQDVALVFINMGASFIGLFPLEDLQPSFTEGDLLEGFHPEETGQERLITDMNDDTTLPVHNFESVLRYLSLCTVLCPRAYTDEELLLLLTMVCRVGLETHFQLLPTGPFSLLLQSLLKNITHWEEQMFKTCQNLSDLSEDHHNLRRLIHLLPDSSRGKQLKRHLSVSIISKLLNHTCTYKPSGTDFKLSELKPFLPQMRPSSLLKGLRSARRTEDCDATLDQQAYYLCYSLLTLTNEASNFEFLPSDQRNDLLSLSSQLEKHIKCDIRESEKMLYRSKVKDFVARIYTKWQVLLQRTRPQEGKLYDYWKPPPEDEIPSSPRGKSCIGAQDEEASESEEETQSGESSGAESDDDARCKEKMEEEEQEEWPKECEDKIAQENEEEVGNSAETEEKSRVPKEQMMELDDENEKLQKDDEELFESHEDVMESDEDDDLMNREEELLKDEEPHEGDGKHIEGKNEALEELEDLLEKDGELLEMNEPIKEEGWEEMSGNSEESGKK